MLKLIATPSAILVLSILTLVAEVTLPFASTVICDVCVDVPYVPALTP